MTHVAGSVPDPIGISHAAGLPFATVLARLGSGGEGVAAAEAARRLQALGPNALSVRRVSPLAILIRQMRNTLLLLLLAAAAVSGLTGDPADAAIIAAIVALSAGLGFANEFRAANAVAALHRDIHHRATVLRDATPLSVEVSELVPGDIVDLQVGDIVPADPRLLDATRLECDEAVLTASRCLRQSPLSAPAGSSPLDLASCSLMGTVVHQGAGAASSSRRERRPHSAALRRARRSGKRTQRSRSGCADSRVCWSRSPAS